MVTRLGDDFGSFFLRFANLGFLILVSFTFFLRVGSGFIAKDSDFGSWIFAGPGSLIFVDSSLDAGRNFDFLGSCWIGVAGNRIGFCPGNE